MKSGKTFLKHTLVEESRAYGFTIAFWGSGTLLIGHSGLPSLIQALLYGTGALTGFGLLSIYVYRNTLGAPDMEEPPKILVLSMIHYLGSLLPIAATYYTSQLPTPGNFFVTGMMVTVLYNLGMVVEELVSEEALKLEKKLYRHI